MKYFRKQFDGQWKVISLSDKEIAEIETQTVSYIKRITDTMAAQNLCMEPILPRFMEVYESMASDLIESKWKAYQAKLKEAKASPAPQDSTTQ